jgi:hypothetical protein
MYLMVILCKSIAKRLILYRHLRRSSGASTHAPAEGGCWRPPLHSPACADSETRALHSCPRVSAETSKIVITALCGCYCGKLWCDDHSHRDALWLAMNRALLPSCLLPLIGQPVTSTCNAAACSACAGHWCQLLPLPATASTEAAVPGWCFGVVGAYGSNQRGCHDRCNACCWSCTMMVVCTNVFVYPALRLERLLAMPLVAWSADVCCAGCFLCFKVLLNCEMVL